MDKVSRLLTYLLLLIVAPASWAQQSEPAYDTHQQLIDAQTAALRRNPIVYGLAHSTNYSQLSVEGNYAYQKEAFHLAEGTRRYLPFASVRSYLHLSPSLTVWGNASYTTGKIKGQKWASSSDPQLLSPYTLADSIGGKTTHETYRFGGGVALKIGDWMLGTDARYRAQHEYRTTDPRTRNIVSDLHLKASVGHRIGAYMLSSALSAQVYKQNNSVVFFREQGSTNEFLLSGLGAYNPRFTNSDSQVSFEGEDLGISVDLVPLSSSGWYASTSFRRFSVERILNGFNSLPLNRLRRYHTQASVGYDFHHSWWQKVYLQAYYIKKIGEENIIGDNTLQAYPVLASIANYKACLQGASAGFTVRHQGLTLMPQMAYQAERESYLDTRRKSHHNLSMALQSEYRWTLPRQTSLTLQSHLSYRKALSSSLTLPQLNEYDEPTQMVRYNYRQAAADAYRVSLSLRYEHPLVNDYHWVASIGAATQRNSIHNRGYSGHTTIGIYF